MTKKEKQIYKSGRKNPNRYRFNPYDYFKKKKRAKVISVLVVIGLIFEILCLFGVTSWRELVSFTGIVDGVKLQDSSFAVYYLDAGQSDCSIVVCDNKVLMIDAGTSNQEFNIRTNLFLLDIDKIDYLMVTHQHDDHMGSAADIINNYSISNIIMPKLSKNNSVDSISYNNLISSISDNDVKPITMSSGDSFMLGSARVDILAPIKQDKDLNNMSLVVKITYIDTSFLFTGDSGEDVEKQLLRAKIDVSADVIKVGHHGSKYSSSENFISAVNPKYAVVSSGDGNNYGHPTSTVIKRFEQIGIIPYITARNGHITIISDGKDISVITER